MQEKVNKMTKIKERIIYFVENQGIKKGIFFNKIDVSSANFRGNAINTPLNSNTIENILANYPQINLHWLITGKGEMLLENEEKPLLNNLEESSTTGTTLKLLDENYSMLQQKTKMQEEIIAMLREKIDFTQQKLEDCEKEKKLFAHIKKMD